MKYHTVASILLIGLAVYYVKVSTSLVGTCASIGYSTACCPLGEDCQAANGDCFCGANCHIFGDCCTDVYCPAHPRTCRDVGITSCCIDDTSTGLCDVHFRDAQNSRCSCNVSCHLRNDCCTDAAFFCVPQTCTEAGKNIGCCTWSSTQSCFVPGGRCYCDSFCTYYNDCCTDVPSSVNYQFCIGGLGLPPTELVTMNPEEPTIINPESVATDGTFTSCGTSVDVIHLTSTITNEDHILWPNEEVIFTCETRGSVLVNNWTSNDYIGDGISLIFNNLELGDDTQSGSRSVAKLTKVNYNYVMVSELHIMTSSLFQTSSVECTNFNGTSQNITFSVLACSRPVPQDGIVIPIIPISQRNDPITFKCKDGYQPTEEFSTFCLQNETWTIDPNDVCSDIDECSNITAVCPKDSQCINTNGSYTCTCDEGYYLHDLTNNINKCMDVDECQFSGVHTCDDSADCMNTKGSYDCHCKPGYKGDGRTCKLFDNSTCDSICDHHCVYQRSGSRCVCDRGYYLASDGITCIDINECNVPEYKSTLCVNAQCSNTNGSYECICNTGFKPDGRNMCIDVNECEDSHNCDLNANCTNTEGSYDCACHESFFGDGLSCQRGIAPKIKNATIQVKPNHELQYNIGTDFCVEDPMSPNFHSIITCQLEEDALPTPEFLWNITFNGTEFNITFERSFYYIRRLIGPIKLDITSTLSLDIECFVSNMFGNDTATTSISLCGPTQCQHGITNNCTQECTRDADTGVYNCSCYSDLGYQINPDNDTLCIDIDECASGRHNCSSLNNWICKNLMPPEKFLCECNLGFIRASDIMCEDIDECKFENGHNCPPSAICINTNGSYDCLCVNNTLEDESGNCTDIDECVKGEHNCSEYAKCKNSYGGYSCECLIGFEGDGETCTFSEKVIIGTSVAAGLLLLGLCLILIITGSVKIIRRHLKQSTRTITCTTGHQSNRGVSHDHITELRDITNSEVMINSYEVQNANAEAERNLVVRSSLRSKLPPMLVIKSANLRVLDSIGQGEFGIVYKGYLTEKYTDEVVAIKTLKGFFDASAVQELLSECARMKNFSNLHVMSLKGVCLDGGPVPYIVLPYMANGSLAAYLKKERKNLVLMKDNSITDITNEREDLAQDLVFLKRKRLMDMCLQVAKGMEYLASENVVHRDLAARNCMIDINMIIKVADFGLSVNIGAKEYYRLTKHMDIKLPVKWMAPESLADYMFSEMSDVWSYGVTCWKIFTGAQAPYPGVRSSEVLHFVQRGERLAMPNNLACNDDLYSMMQWCWKMEPDKRPSFSTLVNTLSESLEKQAGYLHVGAFTPGDNCDSLIESDHNFTSSNEEINSQTLRYTGET